jgi:acetyltransferase-like isoleucine patch superfamily enzyme
VDAAPVEIGADVWVGGGAIPEHVFAAGNPCRVIREIERPT